MDGKVFESIVHAVSGVMTRRSTLPTLGVALLGMGAGQPAIAANNKKKKRRKHKRKRGAGDPPPDNAICCSYPCAGAGGIKQLCIEDSTDPSECPPSFRGCPLYVAGYFPKCHGFCGSY
jgi:hypothetical protein